MRKRSNARRAKRFGKDLSYLIGNGAVTRWQSKKGKKVSKKWRYHKPSWR